MKKGFTLAEMLLTLAIIGIVAALTMPALMTNVQKNSVGASLAKAVNTLSNANQTLIASGGFASSKITDVVQAASYPEELKKYAKLHKLDAADVPTYMQYDMTSEYGIGDDWKANAYLSDDGIMFLFNIGDRIDAPDPYAGSVGTVLVDVNGLSKSNSMGRDAFLFIIDDNGSVIPQGGLAEKDYNSTVDTIKYKDGDNKCVKDSIGSGSNCAGAVADNGWKVLY